MLILVADASAYEGQRHIGIKPQTKNSRRFFSRLDEDLSPDVRRILERAEEFELFSVDPGVELSSTNQDSASEQNKRELFFGHRILAQTFIKDVGLRHKLLTSLYSGIVYSNEVMLCFSPRHGIRAIYKGQTVELLICFECRVYRGAFGTKELGGKISNAPEKLFNQILSSDKTARRR